MKRVHTAAPLMLTALAILWGTWPSTAATPWEGRETLFLEGSTADVLPLMSRTVKVEPKNVQAFVPAGDHAAGDPDGSRSLGSAPGPAPTPRVPARPTLSAAMTTVCPKPPPLPSPQPPPATASSGGVVEISSWEFSVQKEDLVISGEVGNLGDSDLQNVRLQATGFGLNGRQVSRVTTVIPGTLRANDTGGFTIKMSTKPPAIWIQLQIVDYAGRQPNDPLHAVLSVVEIGQYESLARTRIKVAAAVLPVGAAVAHTLCLRISDTGGFPLLTVRVRLVLIGFAPGVSITQVRSADVAADGGGAARVEWSRPVRVEARPAVESVRFAALP